MTQFDILFDAINLWEAGRLNSAKSQWEALQPEFRTIVLQYVEFLKESPPEAFATCPAVKMGGPWGELQLNPETALQMRLVVPKLQAA